MVRNQHSYSSHILIHLEVEGKLVRLSDVLNDTATLYEHTEVPPDTQGAIIFTIDGEQERNNIVLKDGITSGQELITFSYAR